MSNNRQSKEQIQLRDQKLLLGFPKRLATAQILVNGTLYTEASATALIQTRVTAMTNAVVAKAAATAAVKAADAAESATAATVSGLIEAIYVAFGDDPAALADFGLPARKKGTMTPAQHQAAAAKAKATRLARHTMGPKQKAAITGDTAAVPPATSPGATLPTTVTLPTKS